MFEMEDIVRLRLTGAAAETIVQVLAERVSDLERQLSYAEERLRKYKEAEQDG